MSTRKVKLYIACSLNGFIAESDGSVAFLETIPNPDALDYGYAEFYDSIDTTVQGYSTYQQVNDWDIPFPYKGKNNYVFTRKQGLPISEDVTFVVEDHESFLRNLKHQAGGDIWLIGGGKLNQFCLECGLIDAMDIFVMPILLADGIPIFARQGSNVNLDLIGQEHYANGVVRLSYAVAGKKPE